MRPCCGLDCQTKTSQKGLWKIPLIVDEGNITTSHIMGKKSESLKILESLEFDYLINSTGYHKTDEVEDNADLAFLVNSFSVRELAKICEKKNATLIHFSTDYVFGGVQHSEPISEEGITSPLNIYGSSKLMGENLIRHELESHFICRVSSLFGEAGSSGKGGNFVEAIFRFRQNRSNQLGP